MSQSSSIAFQNVPGVVQHANVASHFPAAADPLTQAAAAQVGAVYQAAAAAAYKAVAASGLVPNLPQNVPPLAAPPTHPRPGLYAFTVFRVAI